MINGEVVFWLGLAFLLLGLIAAALYWLISTISFNLLPGHERVITRCQIPEEQANELRLQVFAQLARNYLIKECFKLTRSRVDEMSRKMIEVVSHLDSRRAKIAARDPELGLAADEVFARLLKDFASAIWIREDTDERDGDGTGQGSADLQQILATNGKDSTQKEKTTT